MQAGLVQGDKVPEEYEALVQPHVDSFDFFLGEGLQLVVDSLEPVEVSETMHRRTRVLLLAQRRVSCFGKLSLNLSYVHTAAAVHAALSLAMPLDGFMHRPRVPAASGQ